uniref:Retrotrans_gag domain-containing protein n=2 Tax=Panagrellus redivivus TaxID=6233 RepID=A0A7E4UUX5_PANRE
MSLPNSVWPFIIDKDNYYQEAIREIKDFATRAALPSTIDDTMSTLTQGFQLKLVQHLNAIPPEDRSQFKAILTQPTWFTLENHVSDWKMDRSDCVSDGKMLENERLRWHRLLVLLQRRGNFASTYTEAVTIEHYYDARDKLRELEAKAAPTTEREYQRSVIAVTLSGLPQGLRQEVLNGNAFIGIVPLVGEREDFGEEVQQPADIDNSELLQPHSLDDLEPPQPAENVGATGNGEPSGQRVSPPTNGVIKAAADIELPTITATDEYGPVRISH